MTTTNKKLKGHGEKKAIQNVQPSLQLLPLIMHNIPQAVFWKDRDLVYLGCNLAFAEDAGFSSPEEIVGKTDFDMPWKDQAELYRADDCLVMEKGEPKLNYEEPQTTPNGSTIWLRTSKIPVREAGKVVAVLGMYEDITEHKAAEETSKGEKQRFQTILETIRIPTIISRLSDGQVLYANQAIAEISQVNRDNLVDFKTVNFYANPDDQEKIREALQKSGHIDDFETQFRRADGSLYWALLSSRIVNYEGETCVLSSYMDITERKQTEEFLQQSEARLSSALHVAQMGHWEFDVPTGMFTFNDQYYSLHGTTAQKVGGYQMSAQRFAQELVYPEDAGTVGNTIQQALESADPNFQLQTEARIMHADGKPRWVTVWFRVERDAQGNPIKLHGANQDINERKLAEEALRTHDEFSQKQSSVFAELTRSEMLYSGDVQSAFAEVTEAAAKTLNIQRSSIWYYNEDRTEIRCMDLFEQGKGHSEGIVLSKNDFPSYFKALEDEKVIAADNAHTDPATHEFSASYLTPLGINSMLDAPIRLRGRVIGVICNEHVGPFHSWSMEEQNFARTIVDFVTVAVETQERKQAEERIRIFQALTENATDAIVMANLEGRLTYANRAFYNLAGVTYGKDNLIGQPIASFTPEEQRAQQGEVIRQALTTGGWSGEAEQTRRDGSRVAVSLSVFPLLNESGQPVSVNAIMHDITERKQAEEFLRQSEAKLSSALHVAQMGHWEFDVPTGMFTFNDQYYSLHGTTAQKVGGYQMSAQRFAQELVYPEDAGTVGNTIQQALESADPNFQLQTEARIMHADGKPRWVTVWFRVERDAQGNPIKLHGVNQDINERKLAEEALRTHDEFSQKQSSVFAELTRSEMLYSGDVQSAFAEVTEAAAKTLNIQRSSIWYYNEDRTEIRCMDLFEQGKGHSAGVVLGKADFPSYFKALEDEKVIAADNAHTDPATREFSASYLTPLGINSMLDAPIRLRGRVIGVICNEHVGPFRQWTMEEQNFARSIVDFVTVAVETQERKQTEEFLRQSEADLSSALHVAQMGHWEFDVATGMFTFNDQYYSLHGTTAQKVGGYEMSAQRFAQELVYPEDAGTVGNTIQQALESADPNFQLQTEARIMHADGKPRWVTVWFRVERDAQGNPIKLHGVNQDITERKQAQETIQKSEANYRAIANFTYGWETWLSPQGEFLYVSPSCERISEYPPEAFADNPSLLSEIAHPEDRSLIEDHLHDHHSTADTKPIEFRIITKSGKIRWISHACQAIHDASGIWQGRRGNNLDITARKILEQQIQTALERRGLQVQLSTKVSQSIAAASSLQELYERVVAQVKEQFDYYHTQILRYDSVLDAVVLVNGYGGIGAQMLADGHRLPMGEGLIGTAAATGETVLRAVLENDPDWHPNSLLPDTKGEIAVPIKLGDTTLGVLDVQSSVAGALDADDQLLLEGLCGQIAVAIESTRLRQEMTERLEEINRLYRAMSHEGWQTYRQTADLPSSFMFDQAGLRAVQDTGLAEELFASVPLTVPGGEVIGTLAIQDDPLRPISPEDEAFLQQVSEQVALALESARLFEQTQSALTQVERRASELETVATVSTTASTVLDPDQLLQSVVSLTKERFNLYHAHVYLVNPDNDALVLTAGAGEVGKQMLAEGWNIPISHELSIVASAYRSQHSVVANDLRHDKTSAFLSNRLLPNTRSEMALPLIVGDRVLGVFDVQSDQPNFFTAEDVNIYTTLASQVAVALQNARLYVEQAALVTQLRELDKLKSSFLANMSHELRTPLNSILGFADVIIEELDGPLTENMNNDLRLIQKNGQHLLHLINDVLDMAKIEAGRMNLNPERFTAFEVLEEVTSITSTLASEKNLSLFIEEGSDQEVQIYADRTRLRQVMINLVNNAIKFTETGNISLKVASIPGARILISVKDTGIGIAADKLEPIFQEFTQVDASSTRKAGGTGLGLPISRRLVEMHGGRLWAESTGILGEGSTFFVELPVEARITETVEKQVK